MDADPYLKKTVTLRHGGHTLRFNVAQDLFSSHDVDVGTVEPLIPYGKHTAHG